MELFQIGNWVEAGLWGLFAIGFAHGALRSPAPRIRRRCFVAAAAFALFGVSDVIEVQTGAWWRPWWLLIWKAACLAAFGALLIEYRRRRSLVSASTNPASGHGAPGNRAPGAAPIGQESN